MSHRITIEGRDGAFRAYVSKPDVLPAPAVVVLHEVFGVNDDIREHCGELAEQGFLAVAPDLFWRLEPGVDLSVRSEADWQHALRRGHREEGVGDNEGNASDQRIEQSAKFPRTAGCGIHIRNEDGSPSGRLV